MPRGSMVAMRFTMILPALLAALPAFAQDQSVTAGLTLGLHSERALRPEAEVRARASFGDFYAGATINTIPGEEDTELDLYLGFSRAFSPVLAYDLSYTRILYPFDEGDCCAEIRAGLDATITPELIAGASVTKPTDISGVELEATVDWAHPFSDRFTFGLGLEASQDDGVESLDYEASGTFALGQTAAIKAYVEDGSDQDTEVGLDLNWELGGMH